jgi:CorA-like Mg2+ transporter protein
MSTRSPLGPAKPVPTPLPKAWEVPEVIKQRLGREAGPQRSMLEEGHLLIIVHHPPGADQTERTPAFFWRNPEGDWRSSEGKGSGPVALKTFLEEWEARLLALDEQERKAVTALEYHTLLESAGPILRAARGLLRALQQAREMVKEDRDLISFRDTAANLERSAELLLQDAQFGLNFIAARQAEHQAEIARQMTQSAHRLNLLAALFFPLTAVASLLSMDISSGLPNTPRTFWTILIAGCLLGGGIALWVNRKK